MAGASAILPGEDDHAVAYHSSCGYSTVGGLSKCQSSILNLKEFGLSIQMYRMLSILVTIRAPSVPVSGL